MQLLFYALDVLWWIIIVDAVLSWVQQPHQMPRKLLMRVTDPLYAPFRAILSPEKTGGFDLSPIALLLLIRVAKTALAGSMY